MTATEQAEKQQKHYGPSILQLEFDREDHDKAESIAKHLGYTQTAYTTTSGLWGLFCLRDRVSQKAGCIIKTAQFGMMFVQDTEDMNLAYMWNQQPIRMSEITKASHE